MSRSGTARDGLITEEDFDEHYQNTSVRGAVHMADLRIWLTPLMAGMTLKDLHSRHRETGIWESRTIKVHLGGEHIDFRMMKTRNINEIANEVLDNIEKGRIKQRIREFLEQADLAIISSSPPFWLPV